MTQTTQDPRGTLIPQGNISRINHALVESVSCKSNSKNGYIVISYAVPEDSGGISIENLQLNITRNTILLNSFGASIGLCCIQKGMWVNAVFSSRMTRGIPPQSNALFVTVLQSARPSASVSSGKIASIDTDGQFLSTGNPDDINTQTRYAITHRTLITNRFGLPIGLSALRPGQYVRITHADFMTASIPPQTTAYRIQLL